MNTQKGLVLMVSVIVLAVVGGLFFYKSSRMVKQPSPCTQVVKYVMVTPTATPSATISGKPSKVTPTIKVSPTASKLLVPTKTK